MRRSECRADFQRLAASLRMSTRRAASSEDLSGAPENSGAKVSVSFLRQLSTTRAKTPSASRAEVARERQRASLAGLSFVRVLEMSSRWSSVFFCVSGGSVRTRKRRSVRIVEIVFSASAMRRHFDHGVLVRKSGKSLSASEGVRKPLRRSCVRRVWVVSGVGWGGGGTYVRGGGGEG